MKRVTSLHRWLGLALLAANLAAIPTALADGDGQLVITSARADTAGNLLITVLDPQAKSFGSPSVTLGGTPLTIVSAHLSGSGKSVTGTLAARLPAGVSTGAYTVVVSWHDASDTTFNLTLGVQGATGPTGPVGPKGDTGATGAEGPAGPIGDTGAIGATGPQGTQGATGAIGLNGATGPRGPAGIAGASGSTGAIGATGAAGAKGLTGPAGAVGPKGDTGMTGIAGPVGDKGPKGPTGAIGAAGLPGPVGPAGATGPTGPTGPQGVAGPAEDLSDLQAMVDTLSAQLAALQASITPRAPTDVIALAGPGSATIAFTPGSPNGGAAPTNYTVTASPGGLTATGTTSPITITGLADGVSYTFTVVATNAAGSSASSVASSPVTPTASITAPGAPSIASVTAGNGQVTVAFTPPSNDGGSPITGYVVTSSPAGIVAMGTTSPLSVAGLTNGQGYTFTVTATNAAGSSIASAASASSTPAAGEPAETTFTIPSGLFPVDMALGSDGAMWFTTGSSTIGRVDAITHVTTTYTDSRNVVGALSIAPGSDGALWFANVVSNSIGRIDPITKEITSYSDSRISSPWWITAGPDGALWFTTANSVGRIDPRSHVISIYSNFSINAPKMIIAGPDGALWFANRDGDSIGRIDPATGAITSYSSFAGGVGLQPSGITAGPDGAIWFSTPNSIGRIDPVTHVVTAVPFTQTSNAIQIAAGSDGGLWFTDLGGRSIGRIDPTTHVIANYPYPDINYPFGIAAGPDGAMWFGEAGNGSMKSVMPDSAQGAPTVPSAPVLTGVHASDGRATVSFIPSASDGGSPITKYTVTSSPGGLTTSGTVGPLTVSGLTLGQTYTFTVTATNIAGTSSSSGASNPVADLQTPAAPTVTGVVVSSDGSAAVSFASPAPNGGPPVTSYTAIAFPGGNQVTGGGSPLVVTGLTIGQSYTFVVVAANSVGSGLASAPSASFTPLATVPSEPNITSALASGTTASITIDPTTFDGGSPILYWTVVTSPATPSSPITSNSSRFEVPGLVPGVTYTVTATATNAVGTSVSSAAVTIGQGGGIGAIAQVGSDGIVIDAVTGNFLEPDGSEVDPLTFNTVIPAPTTAPTPATFTYPTYLLTKDPVSGLYTSFFSTTVDVHGNEYDPTGNVIGQIPGEAFLLTTNGTVVNINDLNTQLDAATGTPVSNDPYTVEPTPADYQVNSGSTSAAFVNE